MENFNDSALVTHDEFVLQRKHVGKDFHARGGGESLPHY